MLASYFVIMFLLAGSLEAETIGPFSTVAECEEVQAKLTAVVEKTITDHPDDKIITSQCFSVYHEQIAPGGRLK